MASQDGKSDGKGPWRGSGNGGPDQEAVLQQLRLYNTLTKQKDELVPLDPEGKHLTWYTCGPTVYDAAHLGHARYYVTMDILRRVLEDYFGYTTTFVMNVTDVDDKIIRRARLQHLLQQYLVETHDTALLLRDAEAALAKSEAKQRAQVEEVDAALQREAQTGHKQRLKDLHERLAIEQLKLSRISENGKTVQRLKASMLGTANGTAAACASAAGSRDAVVQAAGDAIAEGLDEEQGSGVTDHEIFRRHAARYEAEFLEDMDALGCRQPTVLTRVSEYMDEIRAYVDGIAAKGMAYASNGSIYFSTQAEKGHTYGKLAPHAINSAAAGDGEANFGTADKRDASDFALWKAAKAGEPAWTSPECARGADGSLGLGRPGWHIECSAMASAILGKRLDIHTGGADLAFPHHENELAQAEAFFHDEHPPNCGCQPPWVNYFLHAGHLNINNMKMSKSLKNFISIRKALESFSPRVLRIMFALAPWERSMTYSDTAVAEAQRKEEVLRSFFARVDAILKKFPHAAAAGSPVLGGGPSQCLAMRWEEDEVKLDQALEEGRRRVHRALLDSLNLAGAMEALGELVRAANKYMDKREAQSAASPPGPPPQAFLLRQVAAYITRILGVFGIAGGRDGLGLGADGAGGGAAAAGEGVAPILDAFAGFRAEVRDIAKAALREAGGGAVADALKRLLAASDRVRDDTLPKLGVRLEDRPDGTSICKLMSAVEQAEARASEAAAAAKEAKKALERAERELARLQKEDASLAQLEARWSKYNGLHGEAGKEKEAKADAKELWKLLKGFRVSQGDGCLSAHERGLAQQVAAGERALNPKSAADVSAKWAALQKAEAEGAAEDGNAESNLLSALARALPEEANLRLEGLVTSVLKRWPAAREALAAARRELGCPHAGTPPSIVQE